MLIKKKKDIQIILLFFISFSQLSGSAESADKHAYMHYDYTENFSSRDKLFGVVILAACGYYLYTNHKSHKQSPAKKEMLKALKTSIVFGNTLQTHQNSLNTLQVPVENLHRGSVNMLYSLGLIDRNYSLMAKKTKENSLLIQKIPEQFRKNSKEILELIKQHEERAKNLQAQTMDILSGKDLSNRKKQ